VYDPDDSEQEARRTMIRRAVEKEAESENSEDSEDSEDSEEEDEGSAPSDLEGSIIVSGESRHPQRPKERSKVYQHKVVRNGQEIVLRTLKCCGKHFKRPTRMNDHFRAHHPRREIPFPRRGGLHNHNVNVKQRRERTKQKHQRYNEKRRRNREHRA